LYIIAKIISLMNKQFILYFKSFFSFAIDIIFKKIKFFILRILTFFLMKINNYSINIIKFIPCKLTYQNYV
jgi:hypothetical protein